MLLSTSLKARCQVGWWFDSVFLDMPTRKHMGWIQRVQRCRSFHGVGQCPSLPRRLPHNACQADGFPLQGYINPSPEVRLGSIESDYDLQEWSAVLAGIIEHHAA